LFRRAHKKIEENERMDSFVLSGFTMRPAAMQHAAELANMIALRDRLDAPPEFDYQPEYTAEDIQAEWQSLDLAADTRLVFAPDGQLAAYLGVATGFVDAARTQQYIGIHSFSGVHPAFVGQGIGSALLRFAHAWARQQHPTGSVRMIAWLNPRNERARRLLISEGFRSDQHSVVEMKATLSQEPAPATWPAGITVCPFRPGRDDALTKSAIEESFDRPFTHWDQLYTNLADFDPTLWHLAWEGAHLVGALICVPNPALGWVDQLGVRPPWRKRGIGQALLQHAIRDFYQRGLRTVALSVSLKNQHGALRLYERAGMRIASQIDRYSKPVHAPTASG
jgi:GNAT superfamily N-acetyltransferase